MYEITELQRDGFANGAMPAGLDENLVNDINYMLEKDGQALVGFSKGGFDIWADVVEVDALCDEELNDLLRGAHVMIVSLNHIDGKDLAIYSKKMESL